MATGMYAHTKEAVHVKVKKCENNVVSEWRKFSVDPQITSLEMLYSLLAKAFDINCDFSIKYKAYDPAGNEVYLAVLSDWDLDAAFLRTHNVAIQTATEPCLVLQIDIKPFTELKEWDSESSTTATVASNTSSTFLLPNASTREIMAPLQQSIGTSQKYMHNMQTKLPGLIMNQMEKTFSMVQKAFNLSEEAIASLPPRSPLSDTEFRLFLGSLGQIQRCDELHNVIFHGGVEPSLRRFVWKHILNVYPRGMTGKQRINYMKRKAEHYYKLRHTWKEAIKEGCLGGELGFVTSMVRKDVLRTDRLHTFYAGSDDNQNISSLFNILTTYALNHPSVSYCQGMSDIASPLLVTMKDEAQAYICFCAIMSRLRGNFMLDGIAMTQKFTHLTEALNFYDPEFWDYLKLQQADDLLFCYRWLLLELKREFPFDDSLRMLEVQWSSLKYEANNDGELALYEKEFVPILEPPETVNSVSGAMSGMLPASSFGQGNKALENPYTKVCALRRQSSSASLSSMSSSHGSTSDTSNATRLNATKRLNLSLDESITSPSPKNRRSPFNPLQMHKSLDDNKSAELKRETMHEEKLEAAASGDVDHYDDDDVFTFEGDAVDHINFHPTNPFIEDAQRDTEQGREMTTNDSGDGDGDGSGGGDDDKRNKMDSQRKAHIFSVPEILLKLHDKNIISNYNAVSNIIAKQNAATTVGMQALRKAAAAAAGGHHLSEKITSASKKGTKKAADTLRCNENHRQKFVKNFNEFLSFTCSTDSLNANAMSPGREMSEKMAANEGTRGGVDEKVISSALRGETTNDDDIADKNVRQQENKLNNNSVHKKSQRSVSGNNTEKQIQRQRQSQLQPQPPPHSYAQPHHHPQPHPQVLNRHIKWISASMTSAPSSTSDDGQDQSYSEFPFDDWKLRKEGENVDSSTMMMMMTKNQCGDGNRYRSGLNIDYEKLDRDSLDIPDEAKEDDEMRRRRQATPHETDNQPQVHLMDNCVLHTSPDGNESDSGVLLRNVDHQVAASSPRNNPMLLMTTSLKGLKLNNPFIDDGFVVAQPSELNTGGLCTSSSLPEVNAASIFAGDTVDCSAPIEVAVNAFESATTFPRTPPPPPKDATHVVVPTLPPPHEFGGGNPFLIFLCLTLLMQHRNTIMKNGLDYNEIAMHFDKMVRKHDVTRVLNQARRMYFDYLKTQKASKHCSNTLDATEGTAAATTTTTTTTTATNTCNGQKLP